MFKPFRRHASLLLLVAAPIATAAAQGWDAPAKAPAKPAAAISKPAAAETPPSLADIDVLQRAVTDAWEKTPMTTRRALFIAEPAENFGNFKERGSNVFKPGEKLVAYAEPVGYMWKANGAAFDFGVAVDFLVKSPEGKILAGQENFARFVKSSRAKLQEFMLTLTLSLDGAPSGDYVVEYKLRDINSSKATTISLPFKIAE